VFSVFVVIPAVPFSKKKKKLYLCFRVIDKAEAQSEMVFHISEELPAKLFKVYRPVVQTRSQT